MKSQIQRQYARKKGRRKQDATSSRSQTHKAHWDQIRNHPYLRRTEETSSTFSTTVSDAHEDERGAVVLGVKADVFPKRVFRTYRKPSKKMSPDILDLPTRRSINTIGVSTILKPLFETRYVIST